LSGDHILLKSPQNIAADAAQSPDSHVARRGIPREPNNSSNKVLGVQIVGGRLEARNPVGQGRRWIPLRTLGVSVTTIVFKRWNLTNALVGKRIAKARSSSSSRAEPRHFQSGSKMTVSAGSALKIGTMLEYSKFVSVQQRFVEGRRLAEVL